MLHLASLHPLDPSWWLYGGMFDLMPLLVALFAVGLVLWPFWLLGEFLWQRYVWGWDRETRRRMYAGSMRRRQMRGY